MDLVYAMARAEPMSESLHARTVSVPGEWYENLQLAFDVQENLLARAPSSLVSSFVVPGSYDEPEGSISIDATDESIRETLEDRSRDLAFDLTIVDQISPDSEGEPTVEESFQVTDLDRKRVPSGVVCEANDSMGTLAPALYDERGYPYFVTSNHLYGAAGTKETEHEGEPLSLLSDGETRRIGNVVRGYPQADIVQVVPVNGYRPLSEIAQISSRTVIGQYTTAGLASLMAQGEKLRKVGAFSNRTTGELKGVDGVTCFFGEICKRGQLKWGNERTFIDGDSGSVNFHEDPEHPEQHVLVGGFNNARTWWPGMDFTWGTGAHHLLAEYGLHF